jgi:ELWxxDGT repeat protein
MPFPRVLVFLVACLWSGVVFAASPYLVEDLNPQSDPSVSSLPSFLTRSALNGAAIFIASGTDRELALWRTDGTSAGTYVLLPLAPPQGSDGVSSVFIVGDVMYLGVHQSEGYRVWKTDGTAAGTVAVTAPRSDLLYVVGVAAQGLFVLDSGLRELELLQGTDVTTLATLRTGAPQTTYLARVGGVLYVGLENGVWKSDGTVAGTTKISAVPAARLVVAGNRLFFDGMTATSGRELWTSDGTSSGTQMVADLAPGAESLFGLYSGLTVFGTGVLFVGARGEIGTSGGTAGSTRILLTGAALRSSPSFATLGSTVFFPFDDGQHGRELWRSDGTAAGTRLVRDASDGDSPISALTAGATRVYYYSRDREQRFELFESDGTEAGTHAVPPRAPNWRGSGSSVQTLTTSGDTVFFSAETAVEGIEPWIRDAGALRLIANIAVEPAGSSFPTSFFAGRDHVFFKAMDRFWRTDGTPEGTERLTSEAGGTPLAAVGNTMYFSRPRASLWRIDEAGAEIRVRNFDRGYNIPSVQEVSAIGGTVYVRASDGSATGLYVTDGTAGGMVPLLANSFATPGPLVDFAGQAYFLVGRDGGVYTTGGTSETTRSVAHTDDRFTSPWSNLIPFNGELYLFAEHQRDSESVLWKFSGTAANAEVVKRFPGGSFIKRPLAAATPKELLFTWQDLSSWNQLWKTDGTAEGTAILREFTPGSTVTTLTELVALGDRVVFHVDDGVHGTEPWVTDGTVAGTVLLRDIHPAGSSNPGSFVVADGMVYFSATDPEHGSELWQSDGTPEGTRLVADVLPGAKSSGAAPAVVWRDRLFFPATVPETGRELWALPLLDAGIVVDDLRVRESAGTANVAVRLTRASNRAVTVAWRTADAAARAGRDYTASNGTVTFAPGETQKTVAVPLLDDAEPGAVRAFTVRLDNDTAPIQDAGTAPIQDAAGAVIIEDDDVRTDVALSLIATDYPMLKVTNAGPSAASNVELCWAVVPDDDYVSCSERTELAPGASFTTQVRPPGSADTILARVSQWEPDSNPANNEKTWLALGFAASTLYVEPAEPRVGQTGTISVTQYPTGTATTVTLTSSDPTVISVPPSVIIPPNEKSATTTFTALRAGTATLTVQNAFGTKTATVRVYGPAETVRAIPIVGLTLTDSWMFGAANVMSVRVSGVAAGGMKPTGTVSFYEGARLLGTVPLVNGGAQEMVKTPTPGRRAFSAVYGGDANFTERRSDVVTYTVLKVTPSIHVMAADTAGTASITITGKAGQPPSGTVTVSEQGLSKPVSGPLAPSASSSSATTVTGLSARARTVTVTYPGDLYYSAATVTIPVDYGKHRSSRH